MHTAAFASLTSVHLNMNIVVLTSRSISTPEIIRFVRYIQISGAARNRLRKLIEYARQRKLITIKMDFYGCIGWNYSIPIRVCVCVCVRVSACVAWKMLSSTQNRMAPLFASLRIFRRSLQCRQSGALAVYIRVKHASLMARNSHVCWSRRNRKDEWMDDK